MIAKLRDAIEESHRIGSLFRADTPRGFSGDSLIGTLQRLGQLFSASDGACYLEVGVFQGLTLLSVANQCRELPCFGIDNFAYFDPHNKNLSIVEEGISRYGLTNVKLINMDYEDALENLTDEIGDNKVALYFVDGPHDYRSQLMSLQLVEPYLHEDAVIVVDDSNYQHVRQANRDFLATHPEWKLFFEAYGPMHPLNMTGKEREQAVTGWWNGVNILVRDKADRLQPLLPPTERSRRLFENDHLIQTARIAEVAPYAVYFAQAMFRFNLYRMFYFLYRLVGNFFKHRQVFRKRFIGRNTYSHALPRSRFNRTRN